MPTGYTAKLMEQGESFKDFAMRCARAFGACIEMRDDSMDKPIPEEFKPSDYHLQRLQICKEQAEQLKGLSDADKLEYGASLKADSLRSFENGRAQNIKENNHLLDMQNRVRMWTPPSQEHTGLKDFMLQQISVSFHDLSFWDREIKQAEDKTEGQYFRDALCSAERDIDYHKQKYAEEVERAKGRTQWVKDLRASL